MNCFKVIPRRLKTINKTIPIVMSLMVFTILLCGSCDLLNDLIGIIKPDDFEPNNTISTAYPLVQGDTYLAHIAEDDADYFSFTTTNGSTTFDELEIKVSNVGPDLIIGVAIYNSEGEYIGQKTANTAGANLSYILRDLQSDETYYVRFSGTWGSGWIVGGGGDFYSEGFYTFSVKNLNVNDEFTGNHSLNDAHPIVTGESYDGVLVSKYEADYFSFTPSSENMQVQITHVGSELKIGIAMYRSDFTLVGHAGSSTSGANYTLDLTNMNTDVTYYLRFSGTWGSGWTVAGAGDFYSYGPYTFTLVKN